MMNKILGFIASHKIPTAVISLFLALIIVVISIFIASDKKSDKITEKPSSSVLLQEETDSVISEIESEPSSSEVSSEVISSEVSSSKPVSSVVNSSSKKPSSSSSKVNSSSNSSNKVTNTKFNYNTNSDIENNVFLDSLVYTGYNLKKHRSDGLMWVYILASQKRAKGWLSKIGYGGGCTGYETNSKGLPDISRFERGGLVCASFVTYVYFNYLPNVAGIDTSALAKPDDPHLAHSWYNAAKKWVKNGQAKYIKYSDKYNGIK
ncbi:MAG: hypothetical protein IKK24_07400, partial [Clostridia bacterium]|nr:hypothetical protein [Clostridia bacterium]